MAGPEGRRITHIEITRNSIFAFLSMNELIHLSLLASLFTFEICIAPLNICYERINVMVSTISCKRPQEKQHEIFAHDRNIKQQ